MAIKVQQQSPEVLAMAADWPIVEALMGGTAAMRKAGVACMPKWPNEEAQSHEARIATATLLPAFARTVSVMTGKPFAKELTLGEDVPPRIADWCDDIDLQGNSLHTFAADRMADALAFGICGVLIDYQMTAGAGIDTLEAERAAGLRPYAVAIRHEQILGWQSETVAGQTVLTQLRLMESKEVPDGEFGTKCVERVRVLAPGAWAVYEPAEKRGDDWVLVQRGETTIGRIPFVPFYGRKLGFMRGVSPLADLAYLNVKHWQSQSDQDTIMHVARVPILAMIGADDGAGITVGASSAVRLPMGAELKFVEHSGAAIAAGEVALGKLEDHMIQTGAELVVKTPGGGRTATQDTNEAEANKSDLQRIVESFEDGLDQVLQLLAEWAKEPSGGHATLFKDFGAATLSDASAQMVLSLQQGGLISKQTAIIEQQRRGILSADIDPEDELAAIAEEGPPLGTMTMDDPASNDPAAALVA